MDCQKLETAYFEMDFPCSRPYDVVGFGTNCVDWVCNIPDFPVQNSKARIRHTKRLGGGQVATAMAVCARFGLRSRYIGRVGDDDNGRFSLRDMGREPMDISLVEVVKDAASQYAFIIVDDSGARTVLWERDDTLTYNPGEIRRDWIGSGSVLHLDGQDELAAIQCARWAKELGIKVCIDVDRVQRKTSELLALTDFFLPTENFAREFTGERNWEKAVLGVAAATEGFTVVTRDWRGCAVVWEGEVVEVPSFRISAVDSIGAGDIFHGAFIYSILQGWSVWRCLRFSNAAGALSCKRQGARGGIPTLKEVHDLLENQKG
jgi:sugar/nucleoside kinase (ribokinase family)